jgi:transcriptional regulator with XRE-family HTH domain
VTAEDVLRALVKAALRNAGLSQAEACRRLGVSTKHLNQMLTGRAPISLAWAEDLLSLCGQRLTLDATPAYAAATASNEEDR